MRLASGRRPLQQNQSSTNDLGEFRLARLEPGNYVLFVAPRRDAMVGFDEPLVDGRPSDQTPAQPLPTYFPSALSLDQAQPIAVARGESISGIEVTLSEG